MTEQKCPYCLNEIRPLDHHAQSLKDAGTVRRVDSPIPIQTQEVTCVLTRIVIARVEQTK